MSKTIIDMPKVTQMLDAGWKVEIWRGEIGSYVVMASHYKHEMFERAKDKYLAGIDDERMRAAVELAEWDGVETIITDDFTPEQALTRMAYKVHGEVI